jgi:hypothetical protein
VNARGPLNEAGLHLDRIVRAWTDEGPQPKYHRQMQAALRRTWPTLAAALDAAVDGEDPRRLTSDLSRTPNGHRWT